MTDAILASVVRTALRDTGSLTESQINVITGKVCDTVENAHYELRYVGPGGE